MTSNSTTTINVTPLIDVLLVLLIIFLVLMPAMQRRETVALPPDDVADASEPPVLLELHADLTVTLDGARLPGSELVATLRTRKKLPKAVFIDADPGTSWDEVVQLVDRVRGLATDPDRNEIQVAFQIGDAVN